MAQSKLVMIIEILFLVSCVSHITTTTADYDGDMIHVAGKVLCQDCSLSYEQWINGSEPIKGAVVSITCMDERRRVGYYGSDKTDERGQFDLLVNKVLPGGKVLKPQLCNVRLVSSPDQSCNIPTNFGDGQTGMKLVRPFTIFRDLVKVEDVEIVDVYTAKGLLTVGHRYLDVRTNEEFAKSHFEDALNIPYMFKTNEGDF